MSLHLDYDAGRRLAANVVMGVTVRLKATAAAMLRTQVASHRALALRGYALSHRLSVSKST